MSQPPQTRTCAMNASSSSGARVSACLWRIPVLPCMAVRGCGRSWVWAEHPAPAASGTLPNRLGSSCYDDSASTAPPSPRSDGLPLTVGNALGYPSQGLSRLAAQHHVRPGVACPPVGTGGLRSPPAQVLCAAKTAPPPLSGPFAWRSRPDTLPVSVRSWCPSRARDLVETPTPRQGL